MKLLINIFLCERKKTTPKRLNELYYNQIIYVLLKEYKRDWNTWRHVKFMSSATNEKPGAFLQGYTELHLFFLLLCVQETQLRAEKDILPELRISTAVHSKVTAETHTGTRRQIEHKSEVSETKKISTWEPCTSAGSTCVGFFKVLVFTYGQKNKTCLYGLPDKISSCKYRSSVYIGFLILQNGIDRLARNVGQKLPLLAA
jgi:hypothetical protein